MRPACLSSTLPCVSASAPGFSGRGRSDGVAARAMKMRVVPSSPSPSAVAGGAGGLDPLRRVAPPLAAAYSSSPRFRPRVPLARRHRPLSSSYPRATPEENGDDEDAPSTSSSSSSSDEKPAAAVDVEVEGNQNQKKPKGSKKATPLGDLLALISPARKRDAGGPPPPTLSRRLGAIRGSLAAVVDHGWRRALTLPGFSHAAAAVRAVDAFTRPGRDAVRDAWMEINERFEMFRVEEATQRWAWESRSKKQGAAWKTFCEHCGWFLASLPYLILCPSHFFFSCVVPLFVGFVNFDHPILNGVTLAWVASMVAGKLRRGVLSGLVGV